MLLSYNDVLYVPGLTNNLLSVSAVTDLRCVVGFDDQQVIVSNLKIFKHCVLDSIIFFIYASFGVLIYLLSVSTYYSYVLLFCPTFKLQSKGWFRWIPWKPIFVNQNAFKLFSRAKMIVDSPYGFQNYLFSIGNSTMVVGCLGNGW